MRLHTLKNQIEQILETVTPARNSDLVLMINVWRKFYNVGDYVKLEFMHELPNEASICRLRRKIQNHEKKFIPTDEKVAKDRGWKEEEWKRYLGYSSLGDEPF